jgi:maltose alpha-D-glucosyltransferase/alpha-amylase
MSSEWYQEAVFYELYIRAYCDSNGDGHGDFRGAITKLDHIQSLGVDCVWILPMYPSPLMDDGYDIADYRNIHPQYGTLDDFKAFIDAAHERGLRVVTDLVMNHTSDQHDWFQTARTDPESPYHHYYVWSDTGQEYPDARIIFRDYEESNWTYDDAAGKYFWHRFYRTQPDLNYDNPAVHQEMFDIMRFWLDMGVDGFRADAIPYLYEREGTNCDNLPETHAFLKQVRKIMGQEYPDAVMIAEANQWPEEVVEYFGDGDEFHMCFHFPVMPRLYMGLKQGNKQPILDILARTPEIPEGTQWLTFLRNHDELTLEMVTPNERQWMWDQYAPEPRMRQNLGIRRRLAPLLDNDKRRWLLLNALLLSLPGTPIIYYGDEIGMGDNIWLPDRHGCRTPMQWSAEKNAGFSAAEETYQPVNYDQTFGYKQVNVAQQEEDPESYFWAMRFLVNARNEHIALRKGSMKVIPNDNPGIMAYWREVGDEPGDGGEIEHPLAERQILCLYNLSNQQQSMTLDMQAYQGKKLTDLLTQERILLTEWPVVKILAPYSSHWLRLDG